MRTVQQKERDMSMKHRIIMILSIVLLTTFGWFDTAFALPPPTNGLTGYWAFDEGSGVMTNDTSGNGNNGMLVRNPIWVTGVNGKALQFNATDNGNDSDDPQVVIGRQFDVAGLPFTLTAWINPADFTDWRAIFSKRDSGSTANMRFDVGLNQGTGQIYVYTGQFLQFGYAPDKGTWTHIAIVASTTDTKLYMNGVLKQTLGVVKLGTSATANTVIGGTGEGAGGDNDPFKGMIDEVRVYNRVLSASEIQQVWSPSSIAISAVTATNITTAGAIITWTTDGLSDSQIQYGLTQTYGSQTTLDPSLVTSHSQALSGLQSNTIYNYRVLSKDTAGNLATSPNFTFTTTTTTSSVSYSTNFDGTENPLSESGVWLNNGLDWTNVAESGGLAYGTQTNAPHGYNDSYALLSGFSSNQTASAVVHLNPQIDRSCTHEVEILLRFADSAHIARGYEINISFDGSSQIMRWNGPIGDFTQIGGGSYSGLKDGDTLKASIVGNVITVYVNNKQVAQATDSTFSTGSPGIGFFRGNCGTGIDFAFSNFSATSP